MKSPSLIIRRLVVTGAIGCDLVFNRGLNVIRSIKTGHDPKATNKCGKTSLVELIQHGLGRHAKSRREWYFAPIADEIEKLFLEIEANGRVVTIERSLRQLTAQAKLHDGVFAPGIEGDAGTLASIDDMSDVMLRLLGLPKVAVKQHDGTIAPLTFPLLMRAFVLHQEDSFGSILGKVQPEGRKADVVGFLTRITPVERYTLEETVGQLQQQISELEAALHAVQEFFVRRGIKSLLEVKARHDHALKAAESARNSQRQVQERIKSAVRSEAERGRIDTLTSEILALKTKSADLEQQAANLKSEQSRLEELVASLATDRQKALRLRTSQQILNSVQFEICPRCLLDITDEMKARENTGRCGLCNRPIRLASDVVPRTAPRPEDIDMQLDEARSILRDVTREADQKQAELRMTKSRHDHLSIKLDAETRAYVSPEVDVLVARSQDVADKESELARAEQLVQQVEALEAMRRELTDLEIKKDQAEAGLKAASVPDRQRIEELRTAYQAVLHAVRFPDLHQVEIDSNSLLPNINGHLYMHVGTALKGLATVSYHLALLDLSRGLETFFPTMLVVDSPAVGDLNNENHDHLLNYFADLQKPYEEGIDPKIGRVEPDWQVILTTRRSSPALEPYVIETLSSAKMLLR
jgi:hypothetical protein